MHAVLGRALFSLFLLMTTALPGAATAAERRIEIDRARAAQPLDRFFDHSVGADFPGTTGRDDALAQLKTAVDELGFRHLRFHAIFHDALGTARKVDGRLVFDFSAIDKLYDAMLARGIRPFVELGFTPEAMATSKQSIFYWKGNTSHPEPAAWAGLVDAFARHLVARYGADEVRRWPFEVWNEPNLDGFWERADQKAYFELYASTARTLKRVDAALQVGGPSTAGADWVVPFLAYAKANEVPVDFVTTHTYGVDGGFLDEFGHDDNKLSRSPDAVVGDVRRVRQQIETSAFPGLPLFITEWSTSYNPRDPVHDSHLSAPYILEKLRATRGLAQAMSYWTYSDLFEEAGPPPAPFHGGFGLMTREGIRKPAWFAYKDLAALRGLDIPVADGATFASADGAKTTALIWDWRLPVQATSNRPYFSQPLPATKLAPAALSFTGLAPGRYRLQLRRTGYRANDAYTEWLALDKPALLSVAQQERLQALTTDHPELDRTVHVGKDGRLRWTLPMRTHDVVLVTVEPLAEPRPTPAGRLGTSGVLTLPRAAAAYGRMQYPGLPLQPREVVITFDDGPRPESTPRVLAALAEQGVRATFFMIGEAIQRHPELARQVRDAGHSVALHSMAHPQLPQLPDAAQWADLKAAQEAFERAFGVPAAAYRFPFLAETPSTRTALAAQRITVLSADAAADDWLPDQTPQMLADRLLQRLDAAGGGIVLLHDAQDQTADALPLILKRLKAQGWRVVHLQWP